MLSARVRFARAALEVVLCALLLQGLAWWGARVAWPRPWPEGLALLAEHVLWLVGVWRLRPSNAPEIWWRVLRVPVFAVLCALLFVWLRPALAQVLPIGQDFLAFSSLSLPDTNVGNPAVLAFVLTCVLRFVFMYSVRAVWLEGQHSLRWRFTALALGGAVLASALVALLPGIQSVFRSDATTSEALRLARELSLSARSVLGVQNENQDVAVALRLAIDALEEPSSREENLPPKGGRRSSSLAVVDQDGQILASNSPEGLRLGGLLAESFLPSWQGLRNAAFAGRCASILEGGTVAATCAIPTKNGVLMSFVGRNLVGSGPSVADVVLQLVARLVATFDALSQAFLPLFLILGYLGYLASQRLARPLEALSQGVTALQRGRYETRLALRGNDEVRDLTAGFNGMAEQLEQTLSALQNAKANAESALAANRRLTANVSHELRTPLAVLRARLEGALLRVETLDRQEQQRLLEQVRNLEGLVDDALVQARAGLGQGSVTLEAVHVDALVARAVQAVLPLARASELSVLQDVAVGLPAVRAEREGLYRALLNLMQNAVRYTPEGGLIRVQANAVSNTVQIAVMDTGIGVAPEDLSRIFEPFYRTDPARARSTGGVGLGLAIVRQSIEGMGAKILAESEPGRGSCFTLVLPLWTQPESVGQASPS